MPRKVRVLALGALALLLLPVAYVGLADGGAPARRLEGGGTTRNAVLES